jgi:hypothetical protein
MELASREALIQRIHQEVHTILTEGDHVTLQGLPRQTLLESLENELRFLGLYSHSDTEAPRIIHAILDQYLDQWRAEYLPGPPAPITIAISVVRSPLVQIAASSSSGIPRTATTHYIGFIPAIESTYSQSSSRPA